jgi:hypothetical protein
MKNKSDVISMKDTINSSNHMSVSPNIMYQLHSGRKFNFHFKMCTHNTPLKISFKLKHKLPSPYQF